MRKVKFCFLLIQLITWCNMLHAQKLVAKSGNIQFLANQKEIRLEFDFRDMDVGKEGTEAEYTAKKVADLNAKKAGSGDEWLRNWNNNKIEIYQPAFERSFNSVLERYGLIGNSKATVAKYTCLVKTMSLFPGIYVGMQIPADVSFDFIFYETEKPEVVLAQFTLQKVKGSASVISTGIGGQSIPLGFDVAVRVENSYFKAGKILAKAIIKQVPLKKLR